MYMQPGASIGFLRDRIGITEGNFFFFFFNKQTCRILVAVVHLLMLVDYERKERLVNGYIKNLRILPALFFAP